MPFTPALTMEDIYTEVCELAREQGVSDQETWKELIDELIQSHQDLAEIDMDEDTEGMKEELRTRWEEYKQEADGVGVENFE